MQQINAMNGTLSHARNFLTPSIAYTTSFFGPDTTQFVLLEALYSCYSRCSTTVKPIKPSMAVFSHGYSLSRIVTYPTNGMKPTTLPITSFSRSRKRCPRAYSSVSSAALLSPLVRS